MNIFYKTSIMFLAAASLTACANDAPPQIHTASLINNERTIIGHVTLMETPNGIEAEIEIDGLTSGKHGMHFHKVGDCSDSAFKNSGGHINPDSKQHGLLSAHGPDNADLPNLVVDAQGGVIQTVTNDRLSFDGKDKRPALFDADGSALVIHASADDQISQPIGGAGARVACAVIKRD
ncbi:MAG: superoxide dismutase family protein [Robiginitomaculum sp.]